MEKLAYSSEEEKHMKEEGITLPLHPSYGRLHKGSDEESVKTQFALSLRRSGKKINWNKKTKSKKSASNKTSLVCHCYKKKGHITINCWYSKACSFYGKKGHLEASCWEKQATCHKTDYFKGGMARKLPQTNNKFKGIGRKGLCQEIHIVVPRNFSTTAS
jgi:hypothetical protein